MAEEGKKLIEAKDTDEAKPDPLADMPKCGEDIIRSSKASFEVLNQLGRGAFGAVFRVKRESDGKELAMKCESIHFPKQVLKHEASVLLAIQKINSPHFIRYEECGQVRERFSYIVMALVGKCLHDLRQNLKDKKFSWSTGLKIAEQTLAGIRDLHRAGFIHRDIKSPNFAIGREEDNNEHTVFILDFGMCRRFCTDSKDLRLPRNRSGFRGTTRYASIPTLQGKDQSRRDDMESWWYMTVELIVGSLPWKHLKGVDRKMCLDYKLQLVENTMNLETMLKNSPVNLKEIKLYIDKLNYASIPDYDHIYNHLAASCQQLAIKPTEPLCWDPNKSYKGPKYESGLNFYPKTTNV